MQRRAVRNKRLNDRYDHFHNASQRLRTQSDMILEMFLGKEFELSQTLKLHIMTPALRGFPQVVWDFQKLYDLGQQLLEIYVNIFLMTSLRVGKERSRNLVNGKDFEKVVPPVRINLLQRENVAKFLFAWSLQKALIYPNTQRQYDEEERADHAIEALYLLVGAVYKELGSHKVEEFIQQRVLMGTKGLIVMSVGLK